MKPIGPHPGGDSRHATPSAASAICRSRRALATVPWSAAMVGRFLVAVTMIHVIHEVPSSWAVAAERPAAESVTEAIVIRCQPIDGGPVSGRLLALDERSVSIESDGRTVDIPTSRVRAIERDAIPSEGKAAGGLVRTTRVVLVSGGAIVCDDLGVAGPKAILHYGDASIEMPTQAIASVAFNAADATRDAGWLAEVPRTAEQDLVVVGTDESHEFVECVIVGITKSGVDVLLDGEAIAVKRSKVAGLKWLRPVGNPGGSIQLDSSVGSVVIGPPKLEGNVLLAPVLSQEGAVLRLPVHLLKKIDYATGRSTSLLATAWLKLDVEPILGSLASFEEVSPAFQPRRVTCLLADGRKADGLRLTPRTSISWAIPKGASRLRATILPGRGLLGSGVAPSQPISATTESAGNDFAGRLSVSVDGRGVFSETVSRETVLDVDLAGGRSLMLVCEYPAADDGGVAPFGGGLLVVEPRLDE